jgi:hypothetical protein
MRWATLLAALLVCLAGCGGVVSSDEPEPVTPAPVPTEVFQYPPGVSSDRVVPSTLTETHVRTLRTTNYTLTTRQTVRTLDGEPILRSNQTRTVSRNADTYRGRYDLETNLFVGQQASNIEFWSNRSVVFARYSTDSPYRDPEVRQWPARNETPVTDLTDRNHVEGYLAGTDVSPIRRPPGGGVVLAGNGIRDQDRLIVPLIVTDPRNLSLRMRVRHDGIVLATRVTYDATYSDERVRVERAMRVTDIGATSVERPEWIRNSSERYTGYG